jgi:hypothetical protein
MGRRAEREGALNHHANGEIWIPEDDRAVATRLARDGGRNRVALERLTSDRAATTVTYRSDTSEARMRPPPAPRPPTPWRSWRGCWSTSRTTAT